MYKTKQIKTRGQRVFRSFCKQPFAKDSSSIHLTFYATYRTSIFLTKKNSNIDSLHHLCTYKATNNARINIPQ